MLGFILKMTVFLYEAWGELFIHTFMAFTALEKQNLGLAKSLGKPYPPRIKFHKTKPELGRATLVVKPFSLLELLHGSPTAPPHSRIVHQMCEHLSHLAPPALEASWWLIFCKDWIPPPDSAMIWHLPSLGSSCLPGCWLVNVQLLYFTWGLSPSKHFVQFLLLLLVLSFTEDKTFT